MSTTTQPGSIVASISSTATNDNPGDDRASASFMLVGGGKTVSAMVPLNGTRGTSITAPFNPLPGDLYTLTLMASVSTDGINPLRTGIPPLNFNPVNASWSFDLQQVPEPSTLALFLLGFGVLVAIALRRA
jgi:hypothetical protein